jgi:RsiW-degrading membrane proteinase PrsW (M82 family)
MTITNPPVVFASPDTMEGIRGRPIWNIIFAVAAILIPVWFGSGIVRLTGDPDRGTSASIALFSCFALCRIVHVILGRNQVGFLSFSLGAQFFLRGALLSVFLAMVMELIGMVFLGPSHAEWKDVPVALVVGFSEEISKILVVIVGLSLTRISLPEELVLQGPSSSCIRWWTVLVESPRALAMAGIAAGFGFMTCENIEYLAAVFAAAPSLGAAIPMAAFRVIFNLHPLITGLAAARLSREVFQDNEIKMVTAGRVTRAILPSILIHAAFDFGLMFAATNPEMEDLDDAFITLSVVLIPLTVGLLVRTYRNLPSVGMSLLVHATAV